MDSSEKEEEANVLLIKKRKKEKKKLRVWASPSTSFYGAFYLASVRFS